MAAVLFKALRAALPVMAVACMVSCAKDTEVEDPYANWKERNVAFIDSIAGVCANPPEGEVWKKYFRYDINFEDNSLDGMLGPSYNPKTEDYVYMKFANAQDVLSVEEGKENPIMQNDTVVTAYQGFLINGYRFDGTYFGKFDREVNDNFSRFDVNKSSVIMGWVVALLNMKPNTEDAVEVFIPSQMAYGEQEKPGIPKGSALKFEMYVDEVLKYGTIK